MDSVGGHRPRNVGWARAAALLYGDWGTSKAYVIGLAFIAGGFSSFPIILAVCGLTGLVGYNYLIVCRHFPDGGGVYSAAREQSRVLAVLGTLLLLADFIVTAAMSCWDAMSYFGISPAHIKLATLCFLALVGGINYFGPKHSGSLAVLLAIPAVIVVVAIIALGAPNFTFEHLEVSHLTFGKKWTAFVGVILALSGVEAIANLTGVMKLDPGSSSEKPKVSKTAARAILPVAAEVVLGTALLGWAMLSLPQSFGPALKERYADMLRFLGEHYGTLAWGPQFGHMFGVCIGVVVGLLLLSAVNTAVAAMIGLVYMLARDREMPKSFTRLNSHGVPWLPWALAILFPIFLTVFSSDLDSLAEMYAIGVVGAITVNLGSCCFNKNLQLSRSERVILFLTFALLFAVEITIANTKPAALFFAVSVIGVGFSLRWYSMKKAGFETVTLKREIAAAISSDILATLKLDQQTTNSILVAARGVTPVLRYALDEARLRGAILYVLYVKELAVNMPAILSNTARSRWQDDHQAAAIMHGMLELAHEYKISVMPVYIVSEDPASSILDMSATLGVDMLLLGAPHRRMLVTLLKGNIVTEVAKNLPDNIQLLIHG